VALYTKIKGKVDGFKVSGKRKLFTLQKYFSSQEEKSGRGRGKKGKWASVAREFFLLLPWKVQNRAPRRGKGARSSDRRGEGMNWVGGEVQGTELPFGGGKKGQQT